MSVSVGVAVVEELELDELAELELEELEELELDELEAGVGFNGEGDSGVC